MGTPSGTRVVSEQQQEQYRREGWFILDHVLDDAQIELLRSFAQAAVDETDQEMDAQGTNVIGLNLRGRRYFASGMAKTRPALHSFLVSDLMGQICLSTIGPNAFLFNEQYVIKGATPESAFSWHQDSGYVHEDHEPYLTCWIALDDVTEENGTVYLLPYSRSGIRTYVKHWRDPVINDKIGYVGSDSGIPVIVRAGSIACFSSVLFHRSGPNLTDQLRRVYVVQYSPEVIMTKDGRTWGGFEQFVRDGRILDR